MPAKLQKQCNKIDNCSAFFFLLCARKAAAAAPPSGHHGKLKEKNKTQKFIRCM